MTARAKKILRIVGVSLAVLVVVLSLVLWRIGSIIESSINTAIPIVLGVPASVESVDVSVLRGKVDIKDLEIGNPEGYDSPYMFHMDLLKLDIAMRDLFKKQVHINKIHIIGPHVWYHQKLTSNNISDFLKQLPGGDKEDKPKKDKKGKDSEPITVVIDHFLLDEGTLGVKAGVGLEMPLAKVELFDLGKDGAFIPLQAVRILVSAVLDSIVHAVGSIGGAALDATGAVGDAAVKGVSVVGDAAVKGASAVGGAAVKGAGAVVKGIGSLFGVSSNTTNHPSLNVVE